MVLKHRGVQVLLICALYLLCAPYLALWFDRSLYAISLSMKDLLLWVLPITVSFFIAHAISFFEKKAPLFILALFLFEAASNSCSVWYAYVCGHIASNHVPPLDPQRLVDAFEPLWRFSLSKPSWWSPDKGSFLGVAIGLMATLFFPSMRHSIQKGKAVAEWVLTKIFARLIPLFVLGFVARMYRTDLLGQTFARYADLLFWLLCFLIGYILFLIFIGSGLSISRFIRSGKNLLPCAGVAITSSCSLSTMPWTIEGVSKNLKNPDLAQAIIPATTNIQQIGDCIANAFLCFMIYRQFHGVNPDLSLWLPFSAVFVLARFATAAVLGGAMFIMLPIYESYLGFTPEMIGIIIAFNVILDPLITCANVVANGALAQVFEKVWGGLLVKATAR